jgi:hypothetical protein
MNPNANATKANIPFEKINVTSVTLHSCHVKSRNLCFASPLNLPTLMIVSLIFIDALLLRRFGLDFRSLKSAVIPAKHNKYT